MSPDKNHKAKNYNKLGQAQHSLSLELALVRKEDRAYTKVAGA